MPENQANTRDDVEFAVICLAMLGVGTGLGLYHFRSR